MAQKTKVNGEDILYHFFKDLLESDADLAQFLIAKAIASLSIWFHPITYQHMPIISPFIVRDSSCRGKNGDSDEWGSPNDKGFFRDDNSIVKGFPKSLGISGIGQAKYHAKRLGNGFVASHVWRKTNKFNSNEDLASRNPFLNTFIPNIVWLPKQLSKLTDREGSFAQKYLQNLSAIIYKNILIRKPLSEMTTKCWQQLSLPKIDESMLPKIEDISFFNHDDKMISRRKNIIYEVIYALDNCINGKPISKKVVSSRYTEQLPSVNQKHLIKLKHDLTQYIEMLDEAS